MFGVGLLLILILYILLSIVGGKNIKKSKASLGIYWGLVVLVPTWYFAGHMLYPSYFEFLSLCKTERIDTRVNSENLETVYKNAWVVSNRLRKKSYVQVNGKGEVQGMYTNFYYYPYGTSAKLKGGASGSAPRQSCPRKNNA